MAAYDAALGACGLGDYNLVTVSSVLPADASVAVVDHVPDLGPVGSRVTVVQAKATVRGPDAAGGAVAWASTPAGGLVYEAGVTGAADGSPATAAAAEARTGIEAGIDRRDWSVDASGVESVSVQPPPDEFGAAVALAVLGGGDPLD